MGAKGVTGVTPLPGPHEEQPWGLQLQDREYWRVLYYDGEREALRAKDFQQVWTILECFWYPISCRPILEHYYV